jgi:PAS domain S-box-containing protein
MDRLTDSVAQGYWAAVISRQEESNARYEAVVEDSWDGIFEIDLDGRLQYANQAFAVIVGRAHDDLEDAPLFEVLVPVEQSDALQQLMTNSRTGSQRAVLTVQRADGVRRVLEVHTQPRQEHEEIVGLHGAVRDVTAAHELEDAKNEFLALITHDLRTPLTSILGLGATLESHAEELGGDQIQRLGTSIRRQCERIARLADDLHDVSQLESRSLVLNLRAVPLAPIVDVSLPAVASYTPGVEVCVPAGVEVLADPRRLEQVMANLIENAIVHGDAPVTVNAVPDERGMIVIAIRDHGPGVPDALASSLFSRVRSFARPAHHRGRGTGLGLALVRGLVEAMGGRVWYEPAQGGGACFKVALPSPQSRSRD